MRLARRPPPPPGEPVVALINVAFILLIFFMLIGRLDATAPFALSPPLSTEGTPMPGGGMTIAVARDGRLALDGDDGDFAGVSARIRARLAVAPPGTTVRINADAAAPLGALLPIIALFDGRRDGDVVLVVAASGR